MENKTDKFLEKGDIEIIKQTDESLKNKFFLFEGGEKYSDLKKVKEGSIVNKAAIDKIAPIYNQKEKIDVIIEYDEVMRYTGIVLYDIINELYFSGKLDTLDFEHFLKRDVKDNSDIEYIHNLLFKLDNRFTMEYVYEVKKYFYDLILCTSEFSIVYKTLYEIRDKISKLIVIFKCKFDDRIKEHYEDDIGNLVNKLTDIFRTKKNNLKVEYVTLEHFKNDEEKRKIYSSIFNIFSFDVIFTNDFKNIYLSILKSKKENIEIISPVFNDKMDKDKNVYYNRCNMTEAFIEDIKKTTFNICENLPNKCKLKIYEEKIFPSKHLTKLFDLDSMKKEED